MKKIILSLLLYSVCNYAMAQESPKRVTENADSTFAFDTGSYYKAINKFIIKSFSTVATGVAEASNFTTYGSFDPASGSYKFNIYGMAGSYRTPILYNFSAKGAIIGDNTGVLFNNSKFSSGTTLSGKVHLPLKKISNYQISGTAIDNVMDKTQLLKNTYDARIAAMRMKLFRQPDSSAWVVSSYKLHKAKAEYIMLMQKIAAYDSLLKNKFKNIATAQSGADSLLKLTSMVQTKLKDVYDLQTDSARQYDLLTDPAILIRKFGKDSTEMKQQYEKATDSLFMTLSTTAQSIPWLSVVGSYNRNKYYTFDGVLPFSQQIQEVKYNTFDIGLELNWFISNSFTAKHFKNRLFIFNLGFAQIRANDIDDYSTSEVNKSSKYTLADSTNTLSKKYNVYTDPITEYKAWKFYGSAYYFIGKKNTMAIHLFPEIEFRDNHTNPFGTGIGFVFAVKNKKDNSIFNVELFTKFTDIGKALPSKENSFVNRNQIGFNFSVPINLSTKK